MGRVGPSRSFSVRRVGVGETNGGEEGPSGGRGQRVVQGVAGLRRGPVKKRAPEELTSTSERNPDDEAGGESRSGDGPKIRTTGAGGQVTGD